MPDRGTEERVELYHGYVERRDDVVFDDWLENVLEEGIRPRGELDHKDTSRESPFDDQVCLYDPDTAPRELMPFVEGPTLRLEVPVSEVAVHSLAEEDRSDPDAVEPYTEYDGDGDDIEYLVEGTVSPEYIEELYPDGHPDRLRFRLDARLAAAQEWGDAY